MAMSSLAPLLVPTDALSLTPSRRFKQLALASMRGRGVKDHRRIHARGLHQPIPTVPLTMPYNRVSDEVRGERLEGKPPLVPWQRLKNRITPFRAAR